MVEVAAPIQSVEVIIAESFPPQYFVKVVSGLPSGCVKFDHFSVERDEENKTFTISVINLEPHGGQIACTSVFGFVDHNIALGSDLKDGETYTLNVNDKTQTFDTQAFPNAVPQPGDTEIVLAPIERIELKESDSGEYTLIVLSRLPNGSSCSRFDGYELERKGDIFNITINNEHDLWMKPCTADLPVIETEIPLGKLDAGKKYMFNVNDHSETISVKSEPQPGDTGLVPAPIEKLALIATDSGEYSLIVVSRLPLGSSCSRFDSYTLERSGDTFNVTVLNEHDLWPKPCTRDLPSVETEVPLGDELTGGNKYTFNVNDFTETIVAPRANREVQTEVRSGDIFSLGLGDSVKVTNAGIVLSFLSVEEDSRCPAKVMCFQAGQARIIVSAEDENGSLGKFELFLESVREDRSMVQVGNYLVQLRELNPNPREIGQFDTADVKYIATLRIFPANL